MIRSHTIPVVFMLLASLLGNGLAWAFHGEVFIHEIDHHYQSIHSGVQIENHNNVLANDENLDLLAHICLSTAYQPFFFTKLSLIPSITGKEILSKYIFLQIMKSIPDFLFRPPRNILFS